MERACLHPVFGRQFISCSASCCFGHLSPACNIRAGPILALMGLLVSEAANPGPPAESDVLWLGTSNPTGLQWQGSGSLKDHINLRVSLDPQCTSIKGLMVSIRWYLGSRKEKYTLVKSIDFLGLILVKDPRNQKIRDVCHPTA